MSSPSRPQPVSKSSRAPSSPSCIFFLQKSYRSLHRISSKVSPHTPRMMLGTLSPQLRAAALSMLLFLLVGSGVSQNIDTAQPIVRSVPGDQSDEAYFGYTLALHQTANNPGDMNQAVNGARYVCTSVKEGYKSTVACLCVRYDINQHDSNMGAYRL